MWRSFVICLWAVSFPTSSLSLSAYEEIVSSARDAALELDDAVAKLIVANGKDRRINALTEAIRAFETALAVMRTSLRQTSLTKHKVKARLDMEEQNISRLIGILYNIENQPDPVKMIHPGGPLATVRAGILLSDILQKLQNPIGKIKSDMTEFQKLENLQSRSYSALSNGLNELLSARQNLKKAISSRQNFPKVFGKDSSETGIISTASETIEAFIKGLPKNAERQAIEPLPDIQLMKGHLPFPVNGRVIREFNQKDAAGIKRPGVIVATEPAALLITPTVATIRYQGQLLDYGMVSILEPKDGILFVFSGLGKTFGRIGDVLHAGDPLGMTGGKTLTIGKIMQESVNAASAYRSQTLYLEVRENQSPQNPLLWFDFKED